MVEEVEEEEEERGREIEEEKEERKGETERGGRDREGEESVSCTNVSKSMLLPSHRNDPSWFRHLIIHFSKSWCHLVCQCTGNYHNIRLTL